MARVWLLLLVLATAALAKRPTEIDRATITDLGVAFESVRHLPPRTPNDLARRVRLEGRVTTQPSIVGVSNLPYTPGLHGPFLRFLEKGGMVVSPHAFPGDLVGAARAMYAERLGDHPYFELLHGLAKALVPADWGGRVRRHSLRSQIGNQNMVSLVAGARK